MSGKLHAHAWGVVRTADAWDYELIWNGDAGLSGLRRQLQSLGTDGWELVTTVAMNGVIVMTLRRPLVPEPLPYDDDDVEVADVEVAPAPGGGDAPLIVDLDSLGVNARPSALLGAFRPS